MAFKGGNKCQSPTESKYIAIIGWSLRECQFWLSRLQMYILHLTVSAFWSYLLLDTFSSYPGLSGFSAKICQPWSHCDLPHSLGIFEIRRLGWRKHIGSSLPYALSQRNLKGNCLWLCSHLWPNQLWQVCGHDSKLWLFNQLGPWVLNVSLS